MEENCQLTVPILDALANFTLTDDLLRDVRETIIDRLESADIEDLPVVIKFILQTATGNDAERVFIHV